MIAKAGLGLIGLSAISIGGVAVTKPHWLGMDYMPQWHSLSEDNDFSNTSYNEETKFGKKYGRYLVGATHKKNSNSQKTNESWWEWAFRKMGKEVTSNKFSTQGESAKVKSGYGKNNSLSKVCEEAYKLTDDATQFNENDENGNKYKKSEVWKYCSVGGIQPQTISEFNDGKTDTNEQEKYDTSNAIGGQESEKQKLLSVKSPNNKWVWDLRDEEFKSANVTEDFFKARKGSDNKKTIKEICKEAYGKPEASSGNDKLQKNDVTKYCGL